MHIERGGVGIVVGVDREGRKAVSGCGGAKAAAVKAADAAVWAAGGRYAAVAFLVRRGLRFFTRCVAA